MAADITAPDKKYVLFSGGMVSVYVPALIRSRNITQARTRRDFETFLVLGFGGADTTCKSSST